MFLHPPWYGTHLPRPVRFPTARWLACCSLSTWVCLSALAQNDNLMTPELLWKLGRLGSAVVTAEGVRVAYVVTRYDLPQNAGRATLYVRDLANGSDTAWVRDWPQIADLQTAPSPWGERLYFVGRPPHPEDGSPQVWAMDAGGGLLQITDIPQGVSQLRVSPTGRHLAFSAAVQVDATVAEQFPDLPQAQARIFDRLPIRHWNAWHEGKYAHLHVAALGEDGRALPAADLLANRRRHCPLPPFGGSEQFCWSPDGNELAFTLKDVSDEARSTNSDVYLAPLSDLTNLTNVSQNMPGYDNNPSYSPDGSFLAWHSMQRAGFESDRNRILVLDRRSGAIHEATEGLDQTAHGGTWSPDSRRLLFVSETQGTEQIFAVDRAAGGLRQISRGDFNWQLLQLFPDGRRALVAQTSMLRPAELAIMSLDDGAAERITGVNDGIYEGLALPRVEQRWTTASDGEQIHSWIIYPPDFDPQRTWPLITYCQGGPQGQVGQGFSYRWNFHLMAARGYVVLAPNRRGLPGFGRRWNDQVSRDWGGQAMQDLLSTTDEMLSQPYIDRARAAAVGASFGGYSVYWLMGHHEDRFCCLLSHCGVFHLESMYGATEELFFPEWELGGPYWEDQSAASDYQRFSPHRFVQNWKTPLMIIHGQKDFRVPVTQAMEAFTAAQVQGVPSRFVYFPEEGHWVVSPQNSVLWQRLFFDWLDRYCQTGDTR